ncbi:DUF1579 domain-containing protein [Fuerstiella marisgermanici]|uniref:DUF1579 domain-containing protein n=1 Tax=Fuerstiella marisgermanici TaxID=1891926 RepID=A0A1P8WM37_9PLAN|nr:DUF1579 domain-containing protein [Fuerstiella marisgermanici]APZ95133.1 hypothetical protein Fuma_04788 [Fuerstiella marisgermanici]
MKSYICRCTVFCILASATPLMAQNAPPEPTEHHKILAREVGTWEGEMKMYTAGPDADPVKVPVVEKNVMMDTGLWLISEFEAGPFKGHGVFGYDPDQEKFVGSWVDNMSTSIGSMKGTHDSKTGETTYFSNAKDPTTGKMGRTKNVGKMLDDDTRSFVMYMQGADGKSWVKWMEISYKRKK